MSDKRYEANIIRATAVEPANNLESTSAPGVWSIDEVVELQKKSKWPTVGNAINNVDSLFSTFLYTGTGNALTITNNIDLSGEGGLVWIKGRNAARNHRLFDSGRGVSNGYLSSNLTNAANFESDQLTAFNSNGFSIGGNPDVNNSSSTYTSWTFRKQAKFFDIVTWSGDNANSRAISHNLGCEVGAILIKNLTTSENWVVYHRGAGLSGSTPKFLKLNSTDASEADSGIIPSAPTTTQFYVSNAQQTNAGGRTYVAYLFAHNNNDGEFGPDQDEDIIKCGSYVGTGSSIVSVDLGFEPQWVLIKKATADVSGNQSYQSWAIQDSMRGFTSGPYASSNGYNNILWANGSVAEGKRGNLSDNANSGVQWHPTSTGFDVPDDNKSECNENNMTYIYIAIRRPQATPTAASQSFALYTSNAGTTVNIGFVPDFWIGGNRGGTGGTASQFVMDRPRGAPYLGTSSTAAENGTNDPFSGAATNTFTNNSTGGSRIEWIWRRARGYFDIVAFTGNGGGSRNITHSLGSAPGMLWLKRRDGNSPYGDWYVQHTGIAATNYLKLNENSPQTGSPDSWDSTYASADVFRVGPDNNVNTYEYIVYLFGSLSGISKIGSYTGSSSGVVTVDCGFTSGARFVLIKRSAGDSGNWYVYDSVRGINSGADDPYLFLDTSDAEATNTNNIEPHSSGFQLTQQGSNPISINGVSYIFYAIA